MPSALRQIKEYVKSHSGLEYTYTRPVSFTASVSAISARPIIRVREPAVLSELLCEINRINVAASEDKAICASVIGGGRGGNNNSYSIGKIWDGTDVFIQIVSKPTIALIESTPEKPVFRVSPNMMLSEINDELDAKNCHCPLLCGNLPYMSLAGGLSTGSHTSVGMLSDIVEGIELLLPNGELKSVRKGDDNFDFVCKNASMGLLGVITAVDIQVQPGTRKLKRTTDFCSYEQFREMAKVETNLASRSVIFSPYGLNGATQVKMTHWEWVRINATGASSPSPHAPPAIAPPLSAWAGRKVANHNPRLFAWGFNREVMASEQKGSVTDVASKVMAPESNLVGLLTEVGVFFDYDASKMDDILQRLQELFQSKQAREVFPVNTAIMIRFPKSGEGHKVAIDFASLGSNLPQLLPFINEFICYLDSKEVAGVSTHFGKSHGVGLNGAAGQNWARFHRFYEDNKLSKSALNKKIASLESVSMPKNIGEEVDSNTIVGSYQSYCDKTIEYLQRRLLKHVTKTYPQHYKDLVSSPETTNNAAIVNELTVEHAAEQMKQDSELQSLLKKYKIATSAKSELESNRPAHHRIESVHRILDQERKALCTNNNTSKTSSVLKWLAVFAAGLCGCVIFSYHTAKAAYRSLNKTTTEGLLVEKIEETRAKYYSRPASVGR